MKQTLMVLILSLVTVMPLFCIDFVPGSGDNVMDASMQNRERPFSYHNSTDDQHWFGTNKWAVRFDFSEVYPTYDVSQFAMNKVMVYFPIVPVPAVPVTIEVFSETGNVPAALLTSVSADLTSQWMEFTLPQITTVDTAWVVVTFSTAVGGPYLSATIGDGTHSFYWNTNTPTQYYQNMFTAGFASEFLISAIGSFELSDVDIELNYFDLKPVTGNTSNIRPEFIIINNSNVTVQNPRITLDITSPNPRWAIHDTIIINEAILPHSEYYMVIGDPEMLEYTYQLPDFPGQIKIKAVLTTEHDAADTLFNNTIIKYKSDFNLSLPVKLVESFLIYNEAQNILYDQDDFSAYALKRVNYFPTISDMYYTPGATQRFNWYGFTGYPMTVVGGDERITGYIASSYTDSYDGTLSHISTDQTFLLETIVEVNLASPYNNITVLLDLRNPQNYTFSGGADPSLAMQSRFYAALFKKSTFYGSERLVFNRWGAYADTIGKAMSFGQSWAKQFSVNISDIGLDSLMVNYELLYWIQHNTTKQIIYANVIPLIDFVSNDDETAPTVPFSLVLAPNPVRLGSELNAIFSSREKERIIKYSIYNCKGQLIQQDKPVSKNGEWLINTHKIKTSGVYIIRCYIEDAQKSGRTITSKFFIY